MRLIVEHNNDEASHLEVGQSLQSHKASEIIDHLASSIIADKLGDAEVTRPKLADDSIVFNSGKFDRGFFQDFSGSVVTPTGADVSEAGQREIFVASEDQPASVFINTQINPLSQYTWANDFDISWDLMFHLDWGDVDTPADGGQAYIMYGTANGFPVISTTGDAVFFIFTNSVANGIHVDCVVKGYNSYLSTASLAGYYDRKVLYNFRVYKVGTVFKFYIDDVLVATIDRELTVTYPLVMQCGGRSVGALTGYGLSIQQFSFLILTP